MDNIEFNAHVESVISFLRTLVIKVESLGVTDNNVLLENGHPPPNDKKEWRYYLNMAGEYHYTDTPMYVNSIDNGDSILFSKDQLDIHLATRRAYQPGEYWYQRLIETYPGQVDLIHGILDPINVDVAIKAEDYKILRYNKNLIGPNEDHLIPELQHWITAYAHRHLRSEYLYTEDLKLPTELATMYGLMIPLILIIRLEAYGTRYVSDYHLWNRLNSYGNFSGYRKTLGASQKMWLYRNIQYLRNNMGKNFTLEELIDNLLTPESVPIFHYKAVMDTSTMMEDGKVSNLFYRERLNFKELDYDAGVRYDSQFLLNKERMLAVDNNMLFQQHIVETEELGEQVTFNDLSTKVLDSSMEDYTNRHSDTLMKTLFHQWIYMVSHRLYESIVDIVDPLTGNRSRLNTKDALIYWELLTRKYREGGVKELRPFWYQHVLKKDLPLRSVFRDVASDRFLPDKLVDDIRKQWFPTFKAISPDKFFEHCFNVHQVKWNTKKIYSQFHEAQRHMYTRECVSRLYENGLKWLHDPEEIPLAKDWLEEKELRLDEYDQSELLLLSWDIFTKATGWDVNGIISLREIQGSLINLMMDLSSYTIQYVKEIDDGNTTAEAGDIIHLGITGRSKMSNVGEYLIPPQLPLELKLFGSDINSRTRIKTSPVPKEDRLTGYMDNHLSANHSIELNEKVDDTIIAMRGPLHITLKEVN